MGKEKKSQKKTQKKENRIKVWLSGGDAPIRFSRIVCCVLLFYLFQNTITYPIFKNFFIKDREIACLRHKFSNEYCRCYAFETKRLYNKLNSEELHKVAHQNCIHLFDGSIKTKK